MANPGFSLSELIIAARQVKNVYDAFFDKHSNSSAQIIHLAECIEDFRDHFETHKGIVEARGLGRNGYKAIERTLEECTEFLQKYNVVRKDGKFSAEKALKTVGYLYDQDKKRLHEQIATHYQVLQYALTSIIALDSIQARGVSSQQVAIADPPPRSISPPPTPDFVSVSPRSRLPIVPSSPKEISRAGRSVTWDPNPGQETRTRQKSFQGSPRSRPDIPHGPHNFDISQQIPEEVLPPAALSFSGAKIYFGSSKSWELKRRALGRDLAKPRSRELVSVAEDGSPRLNHQIKLSAKQPCYPYTWHRRWKGRELEVTFKCAPANCHSLQLGGEEQRLGSGIPLYVFNERMDFVEFQSQVRGKQLIEYFEFRQIKTGSSSSYGAATDQHLKIWKDGFSHVYSISFFASAAEKACDMEFPVSMFYQDINLKEKLKVDLEFIVGDPKRRHSRRSSRSATITTTASSVASSGNVDQTHVILDFIDDGIDPSIFSRTQTGFSTAPSMASTVTSRNSEASFGSIGGSPPQGDNSKRSSTVVEEQARRMKYLNIEFSDSAEASRFRRVYEQIYAEEISRESQFFIDWQMNTDRGRGPGSSISNASIPGTPLFPMEMSPRIGTQESPELRPQR